MTDTQTCCNCKAMTGGSVPAKRAQSFRPELRDTVNSSLKSLREELTAISYFLHENPEIAYKEVKAHAKLTEYLKSKGYEITNFKEDHLKTAFRISYTRGKGRTFGLNSEYDALEGIGHACGHNLIAICGIGAFMSMRAAMEKHNIKGTIVLIGTHAEEGAAGKVELLKAGAYEGVQACMMLHPAQSPNNKPGGGVIRSLALQNIKATFKGRPAHAGLAPWEGINALDAAVMAYSGVSVARQQLKPGSRVQGVITYGGGLSANVIPARSELNYIMRAPSGGELQVVHNKIVPCFDGAAVTTGCKLEKQIGDPQNELRNDAALSYEYAAVMGEMWDLDIQVKLGESMGASTDFGNVTQSMPASHPMFFINSPDGQNHTEEFTTAAKTDQAHDEAFKAMAAMAVVGLRFLDDEEFANDVQKTWEEEMDRIKEEVKKLTK